MNQRIFFGRMAVAALVLLPAMQGLAQHQAGNARTTNERVITVRQQAATARAEVSAQRRWAQQKGMPASVLARLNAMEAELAERSAELERAAGKLQSEPGEASERGVRQVLDKHGPSQGKASRLPSTLPWGAPRSNKRMPAETKAAWHRMFSRDDRVQLAQAGGLTTIGGVRFSSLPEAGEAPQDADLAQEGEVQLTPAIRAKAQELGGNPVNIANWVRANIQFVPTWGALQSADATLRNLRGNAIDTTTLVIALLRASGIPARYQFGTVDVPAEAAMNWFGGVTRPEAALDLLLQGGIAARGLTEAGQIRTIRMEHAWATAYVYWSPGRGARTGGPALQPPQHPSPNAALNAWVPVDTAYKQHAFASGANLGEVATFNPAAAISAARQGATCTAASATNVNQAALAAHYDQFRQQAQQQVASQGPDLRVAQVLGSRVIAVREQVLLPGTLAFPVVLTSNPTPVLASTMRWRLQLALLHGMDQVLGFDRPIPEIEGRQLHLTFVPESDADAQVLAAMLRPDAGGDAATGLPPRVAAYLVKLKAQMRLDGQLVAEGGSFTLGQSLTLRSLLQNTEGNAGAAESIIVAGETHVWAVQGQAQGTTASARVNQRLLALRTALAGAQLPAAGTQSAELLHGVAHAYQASLDAKSRLYQRVAGTVEVRLPGIVRASSRLETEETFGLVLNVRPGGVALHADRLGSAVASRTSASSTGYVRQSLERASAETHHLLNRTFGPGGANAQSALSGLAWAAAQGQPIWRADPSTLPQVMAALDADSSVRGQVEQAAANGMEALVATAAVDLGAMPMDPLVLHDAQAGTAAYSTSSRSSPVIQVTAQRPGPLGWLGLADAQASKLLVLPAIQPLENQLNTVQVLLGDFDNVRWDAFAGQSDLLDGLYQSRLAEASSKANACDWLISTLATQLGVGLPGSGRVNRAPVISSQPLLNATAEAAYTYAVAANDPDGDALSYSLVMPPTGMMIGADGQVQWPRASAGQFAVTVRVTDGQATAEQSYVLTVGAGSALTANLALSPMIASPGQTVTLTVTSTAGTGAITRNATLNGAPLALTAQGIAVFAAPAAGAHPIVVTVSNGAQVVTREAVLTVRDGGDTQAPQAVITSPEVDAGLRGLISVNGTATDAKFAYYQLLIKRVDAPAQAWQEVARGLAPVVNNVLGQVDTTRFENGPYQIGLRVLDVNGAENSAVVTVDFIGNLKLGQFRLSFADVRADAAGLPLMLTRTYDSTRKDVMGDFGWGWSASGNDISIRKNVSLGTQWHFETQQLQLCLRPAGRRRISITLPDGGLYRFDARNSPECAFGQEPQVNLEFTPLPGPTGGAAGRVAAGARLKVIDGSLVSARAGMLVDEEGNLWNPRDFELTTEEGFKYHLREGVGILSVTDPYGNRVTYGANGYQHSANLGLTLLRDLQGRIIRATDPAGKSLNYAYNGQGELESVTDRAGLVTRFSYSTVPGANTGSTSGNADMRHLLASITDPRGQVVMSNQFDQYGRLMGSADSHGHAARQEFDLPNSQQTVTDRRGNRTVYTFDADGNITQSVNALGQTTTFAFDANGNETSVTNALAETTSRTFDPGTGKQLSERNHLGHTTATQYHTVGAVHQRLNPLSTTDARGNVTQYWYSTTEFDSGKSREPGAIPLQLREPLARTTDIGLDVKGNLRELNIAGERTSYTYDGAGRRVQEANGLGQVTTYGYDASGNETSRTVVKSVNGATVTHTTTRSYDVENRFVEETDALGGRRRSTYNAAGKLETQTDALGRMTRYAYDANARLVKTEYPDGSSEGVSYDAEGNEVSRTDRAGRTTRMEYDALNRLFRTQHPDGSSEATEYDAVGRVAATVDRRGKRATMEYDGAGRQTASVDATGRRTTQGFDPNGNRTGVTVDGRTTAYEYDALNRLTKTTWPDGSTHTSLYRTDNRKASETDARGVTTSFGYDAAGRLTSVAQSLSATATATTAFGYEEAGGKVRQVDAMGRSTTWTLDANGRTTARTVQDGSREASVYDAEGNRVAKTNFAGETLNYTGIGKITNRVAALVKCYLPGQTISVVQGGRSCDEYPFASTSQGGAGATIAKVPLRNNLVPGGIFSAFYQTCLITPDTHSPLSEFVVIASAVSASSFQCRF